MIRRKFALAIAGAMMVPLAVTSAHAGCTVPTSEASADAPHVIDLLNDWHGVATGYEDGTVPGADLYREGIDITKAWIGQDAEGNLTANIEVATLSKIQPNSIFYMLWDYEGSSPERARRFVSARLKGYAEGFTFGSYVINPVTGDPLYYTDGQTTGSVTEGTPGTLSIVIPRTGETLSGSAIADWGAPTPGSLLVNPTAESKFLVGSPESLPPNPSGLRHGFVYEADDTTDASDICEAEVPL